MSNQKILEKRKLSKTFTFPYLLFIEFVEKAKDKNMSIEETLTELIRLFVEGKLDSHF